MFPGPQRTALRALHSLPWLASFVCLAWGLRPDASTASTGAINVKSGAHLQHNDGRSSISVKPNAHMQRDSGKGASSVSQQLAEKTAREATTAAPAATTAAATTAAATTGAPAATIAAATHLNSKKLQVGPESPPAKRTNVCQRMQQVSQKKLDLEHALQGLTLTAVTRPDANNYLRRSSSNNSDRANIGPTNMRWSGYDFKLLEEVAKRGKFTVSIVEEPLNGRTKEEWLRETSQNYDINLEHHSVRFTREHNLLRQGFTFLDSSLVLVSARGVGLGNGDDKQISLLVLLDPYDKWTWAAFLASIFVTSVVYFWLEAPQKAESSDNKEAEPVDEDKESLSNSLFYVLQHLSTIANLTPKTPAGKVVAVSWSFFSVVFVAGYTANLANCLMAVREERTPWHNIDDVMNANARVCTPSGASMRYMRDNYPHYEKVVSSQDYVKNGIKNLIAGQCEAAIVWKNSYDLALGKQEYNPDCKLQRVGPELTSSSSGWSGFEDFSESCTALIQDVLHILMQGMKEDQTLTKIYNQYLLEAEKTRKTSCDETETVDESSNTKFSLPISSTGGLFVAHFGVLFIAAVCVAIYAAVNPSPA